MRKKKLKLWDVNVKLQAYNLPVQDINSIVRKKKYELWNSTELWDNKFFYIILVNTSPLYIAWLTRNVYFRAK